MLEKGQRPQILGALAPRLAAAHLTSLPSSQEATLYHNQTAELRELLEFSHMYLQSDDEVSGPLPHRAG